MSLRKRAQAMLRVGIDSDTHATRDQVAYDVTRTAWLKERGYRVIRFQAHQVERDLRGVRGAIRAACEARAVRPNHDEAGS